MREIRVFSVMLDPGTGLFDDEPLREYMADRELLRAEPKFFVYEGRPCWTVFLETRLMRGAVRVERSEGKVSRREKEDRAAFERLLKEMDEVQRGRYDRLVAWRREAAHREGIPPYVLFTNSCALELARAASLCGHLSHANARALRCDVIERCRRSQMRRTT